MSFSGQLDKNDGRRVVLEKIILPPIASHRATDFTTAIIVASTGINIFSKQLTA